MGCRMKLLNKNLTSFPSRSDKQSLSPNVLVGLDQEFSMKLYLFSQAQSCKEHTAPDSLQGLETRAERIAVPFSSPSLGEQSQHPCLLPCPKAYENKLISSA